MGVLREVVEADLPVFYEHQRDPEATAMAAFPSRDRDAFMAHWARTLANDSALTWTIVCDGEVAGNIGCWEADGRRLVGYWIGREFWGRGLATEALAELMEIVGAGSRSLSWSCAEVSSPDFCEQTSSERRRRLDILSATRVEGGSRPRREGCEEFPVRAAEDRVDGARLVPMEPIVPRAQPRRPLWEQGSAVRIWPSRLSRTAWLR
jgi:hypothetical protein